MLTLRAEAHRQKRTHAEQVRMLVSTSVTAVAYRGRPGRTSAARARCAATDCQVRRKQPDPPRVALHRTSPDKENQRTVSSRPQTTPGPGCTRSTLRSARCYSPSRRSSSPSQNATAYWASRARRATSSRAFCSPRQSSTKPTISIRAFNDVWVDRRARLNAASACSKSSAPPSPLKTRLT